MPVAKSDVRCLGLLPSYYFRPFSLFALLSTTFYEVSALLSSCVPSSIRAIRIGLDGIGSQPFHAAILKPYKGLETAAPGVDDDTTGAGRADSFFVFDE